MNYVGNVSLNPSLDHIEIYPSKEISRRAEERKDVISLSFGEPEFGPPAGSINHLIRPEHVIPSLKRYQDARGSIELRTAISNWYSRRYGLSVDPDREIMVTHGGVEAITLAILCVAAENESIVVTEPSYMLYERTIEALGRSSQKLSREGIEGDYQSAFENFEADGKSRAIIVNSPENPTGHVLGRSEWSELYAMAVKSNLWVIHDEVYDTMTTGPEHVPIRSEGSLDRQSILINSFSKKFGVPGLRIGWMVADEQVIDMAAKLHDYLYLGVNIFNEKIATSLLNIPNCDAWLSEQAKTLADRALLATETLSPEHGFSWNIEPSGAMFLFPDVRNIYAKLPRSFKKNDLSVGEAVSDYLFEIAKVAVVPGNFYGPSSAQHIRMVTCGPEDEFRQAISQLASAVANLK